MGSHSRISQDPTRVRTVVADKGVVKRKLTALEEAESNSAVKKSISLRGPFHCHNPAYDAELARSWHEECIRCFCRQNEAFRRCLLATGNATIIDYAGVVLKDLMEVRKKVDKIPVQQSNPDPEVVAACKPYKREGEPLNEVMARIVTAKGEVMLIPLLAVTKDELEFVAQHPTSPVATKIIEHWKGRGITTIQPGEAVNLVVAPLQEHEVMYTINCLGGEPTVPADGSDEEEE